MCPNPSLLLMTFCSRNPGWAGPPKQGGYVWVGKRTRDEYFSRKELAGTVKPFFKRHRFK